MEKKTIFNIINGLWSNKLLRSIKYDPFKSSKQIRYAVCVLPAMSAFIQTSLKASTELGNPRLCVQCKCEHAIRKCRWTCQDTLELNTHLQTSQVCVPCPPPEDSALALLWHHSYRQLKFRQKGVTDCREQRETKKKTTRLLSVL